MPSLDAASAMLIERHTLLYAIISRHADYCCLCLMLAAVTLCQHTQEQLRAAAVFAMLFFSPLLVDAAARYAAMR